MSKNKGKCIKNKEKKGMAPDIQEKGGILSDVQK